MRSILLQLLGQPVKCESWSNAPVAHGVQITVYSESGGGPAATLAQWTHAALERKIADLNAIHTQSPCYTQYGQIFPAHTCAGRVSGLAGRVLIFIADGSAAIDPVTENYFSAPGAVIIPIVDQSIANPPQRALPAFMRTMLAETTTNLDPDPLIPRLLRGAGIVGPSARIFISYRHADAAVVAGQFFHALAERGFEPFLDRFSSRPGDDFVDLIREELRHMLHPAWFETLDLDLPGIIEEYHPKTCIIAGDSAQIAERDGDLLASFKRIVHFRHLSTRFEASGARLPGEAIAADDRMDSAIAAGLGRIDGDPAPRNMWDTMLREGEAPQLEPFVAFGPALEMTTLSGDDDGSETRLR